MSRFITACSGRALPCSRPTPSRAKIGYPRAPLDDLLVFPRGVRQDRAGHLAQRGRQSRLCRLPFPESRLSRRHAQCGVGSDRAEGEFQPQDRHRLCALARLQPERRHRARLRALGDGAQTRRGGAGAGGKSARAAQERGAVDMLGDACPIDQRGGLRQCAGRQPAPLRRLQGGREDRPRRRHHGRGRRAHDRDAALPEHRAHSFQPVRREQRPLRPPADLWRPRHLARARALVQRASAMRSMWRRSMAGGTWRRCLPG